MEKIDETAVDEKKVLETEIPNEKMKKGVEEVSNSVKVEVEDLRTEKEKKMRVKLLFSEIVRRREINEKKEHRRRMKKLEEEMGEQNPTPPLTSRQKSRKRCAGGMQENWIHTNSPAAQHQKDVETVATGINQNNIV